MCGPSSALGLDDAERDIWPRVREHLRQPGRMMGLMRGVLGADAEVAAVVSITPEGIVQPRALLATPAIVAEIELAEPYPQEAGTHPGRIGDYEVEVLVDHVDDHPRPLAVLVSPWIHEHLTLYARKLWSRHQRPQ